MHTLTSSGTPVLPVHDSLIVPASAVAHAREALVSAFVKVAGITPRLKIEGPAQMAETALA